MLVPTSTERTGSILRTNGGFGFIKQDCGEPDMFVMPQACTAFGGIIPSVGSRIAYNVVSDTKTGRPRAESVRAEGLPSVVPTTAYGPVRSLGSRSWTPSQAIFTTDARGKGNAVRNHPYVQDMSSVLAVKGKGRTTFLSETFSTGTMEKDSGRFGFIKQDLDNTDMFVMPAACAYFGGVLPPVGTRVQFNVVTDEKTGRPRAENVLALAAF